MNVSHRRITLRSTLYVISIDFIARKITLFIERSNSSDFCSRTKRLSTFFEFHSAKNYFNMLGSKGLQAVRRFSTTAVRRSDHAYQGPGHNLPFDVYSKYKFTLYTALFFSSGFGLPFLMVRYVRKRSG